MPYGTKVFILTLFANPKLNGQGNANVRCDFRIVTPAGDVYLEQKDINCFSGPIGGSPYNVRLSAPVIVFAGEPGDPTGIWSVEVKLRDVERKVELPLRTTLTLTK